jgi:hypothetical protein
VQLVVLGLQLTQRRVDLALLGCRDSGAKGFASLLELVLEQVLIAAPRVQCGPVQGVALIQGQEPLWLAPLARRHIARQVRRMRRTCCVLARYIGYRALEARPYRPVTRSKYRKDSTRVSSEVPCAG